MESEFEKEQLREIYYYPKTGFQSKVIRRRSECDQKTDKRMVKITRYYTRYKTLVYYLGKQMQIDLVDKG